MALNNLGMGLLFTAKDLASRNINKLERRFKSLDATTEATEQKFSSNMKKMGIGLGLFAAGAIGLRALGGASKAAKDFEKSIAEVSTLVEEATFSTEKMRNITMDLGATFGADALKQAPALYATISGGITDAGEATKLLNSANRLAIGGVAELTDSTAVLIKAVNVYEKSGLTAAEASDSLFVAVRQGVTTIPELSKTIGRVAPLAASLGVTFDELNASIAAVTKSGLSTKESVTGLKATFANIIKPTADAAKEAKRLGIQFDAAALRSQGLVGFLDSLTGSAKFNEDSLLKLFGSIEAVNSILALTANNAKFFTENMAAMENKTGATDAAFKKMNETLDQQLKRLGAVWTNIKIGIGTALAPFIKILATAAEALLKLFDKLPGPVKEAFAVIFAGLAILLTVGGAVLFFSGALGALGLLMPGIGAAAAVMWAAIFGPIGLIIIGVGLLATAIIIFWDDIVAAWRAAVDIMVGVIEDFVEFFRFVFNETALFLETIANAWVDLWTAVFTAIGQIALKIGSVLIAPFVFAFKVVRSIIGGIVDVIGGLINLIGGALTSVFEFFGSIATAVGDAIVFVFQFVASVIEKIVEFLKDLRDIAEGVINAAKEAGGFVLGAIDVGGIKGGAKFVEREAARVSPVREAPTLIPISPIVATAAASGRERATNVTVAGGTTEVTSNIKIELDGEVVANAVTKQLAEDGRRRSQPTPGGID